jgi:glycosyltransferase involved in cell wall biosynthesis
LAGAARARAALEDTIRSLRSGELLVEITLTGWLEREQLCALIDRSDLLAVPSLWPEPFGLVGVEAGLRGVPAVAFDAGGISSWLKDGVNGRLVRSRPPAAQTFASALVDCLADQANHTSLRQGARKLALRFTPQVHLANLTAVLYSASRPRP